jgi:hypothetical protein
VYGGRKEPLETVRQRAPIHKVGEAIMKALAEVDRAQGGEGAVALGLVEFALIAMGNYAALIAFDNLDADAAAWDAERKILEFARDVAGAAVKDEKAVM